MKILVVLTFYHPHWTGLTAYAKRIAEGLVARGHTVTVLASQHNPDLPREELVGGVRVVRLPYVARVSRGVLMPGFPAAVARLIAEHDIVHVHTPMLETAIVTGIARLLGKPSIITHQGDLVMPSGVFNGLVQYSVVSAMTTGLRLATRVVVHSADYGRHSAFLAPIADKLDAIYPPVEMPEPQADVVAAWRQDLGLEGKQLIGFAGRFVEEKGFDYLLQAMPLVQQQLPNAHFVYAGETHVVYEPFFERWRHLFENQQERISTLGLILDKQQLANFYAMCDLFVLPSRSDCFPSVQIESLLSGTPLVTTDIPGAREVVQATGMGRLVRPRDPQALADGIIATLTDPAYARPSRDAVRQTFDTARSLDEYEALMQRLVAERGVPATQRNINSAQQQARATLQAVGASTPLLASTASQASTPNRPHLTTQDRDLLSTILQNEADMAYRRRVPTLMDFLELRDGETVLDCGCGMGFYLMTMGKLRNLNLVGVDGDVGRLDWAERERVPATLTSVDIHDMPFADNSFDKVLMTEVLEHLADDRAALREVFRILKPGGILALSVPHANYPFLWDPINKTIEALGLRPIRNAGPIAGLWSNHWRLYRPAELHNVMTGAGFQIEALEEQTHYAFPFIHFIVYGIGKPLIEKNLLPQKLRDTADRFRGERNSGSLLNPINLGVKLFRMADTRNDYLRGTERTFVSLVVKARKPT
jgi:glycosyltransferase involved in cell wall biosynthesis/ubiquinone/menaquinone biosynthesis C-methylase UbiE